ncbi:hypothetical protein L0Z72_04095, partial [candidate division KSB1 bacterium]|nr:hypothetical protein [candidate division KSB1 bacterium]
SSPFRLFLLVACRILKISFETYRDWYYFLEAQIENKPTGKLKQNVVSENISITSTLHNFCTEKLNFDDYRRT